MNTKDKSLKIRIIASGKTWMEGDAVTQLKRTAELPGVIYAVGMPDLHPGKGSPVGAAFFSEKILYPYVIGNDIGCGMGLWQTDIKQNKIKRDRWAKKLTDLEIPFNEYLYERLEKYNLISNKWDSSLGTIGGGNHFAELQQVESIEDEELFCNAGLDKKLLFLLVHSGSRGLGEEVLRKYIDQFKNTGLEENSDAASEYIKNHDYALNWARLNREIIAHRFLKLIGAKSNKVLDACHNSLNRKAINNSNGWLHRKGVAPSDEGLVIIAGSRGSLSYLVSPIENRKEHLFSIAHGAGRKWKRGETKGRLINRFNVQALQQTQLGSMVICKDKELLYEEAPQAYKDINVIISDLKNAGLIKVIATLKPVITYKTGKR